MTDANSSLGISFSLKLLKGERPLLKTVNCVPSRFDRTFPANDSLPLDKSVGSVDIK